MMLLTLLQCCMYCNSDANKCCCCITNSPLSYFFLPDNCVSDFVALLCSTERILFTSFSVPRVLIAHARSLQTFTAVLDWLTHLVAISCWYRSDARQDESQKMLYCKFQKYEVMTMSVVEGQPKSHENATNKATRHVERTFTRLVC